MLNSAALGLPCYHTIWQRQQESGAIRLEDIHPHWYITRPELSPNSRLLVSHPLPILNPLPVQGRGRPRGALGGVVRPTSTRLPYLRSLLVQPLLPSIDLLKSVFM